jgi:hypothetical protein
LFLYNQVLEMKMSGHIYTMRSKKSASMTVEETNRLICTNGRDEY